MAVQDKKIKNIIELAQSILPIIKKMPYEKKAAIFEERLKQLKWPVLYLKMMMKVDHWKSFMWPPRRLALLGWVKRLLKENREFIEIHNTVDFILLTLPQFFALVLFDLFFLSKQILDGLFGLFFPFKGLKHVLPGFNLLIYELASLLHFLLYNLYLIFMLILELSLFLKKIVFCLLHALLLQTLLSLVSK